MAVHEPGAGALAYPSSLTAHLGWPASDEGRRFSSYDENRRTLCGSCASMCVGVSCLMWGRPCSCLVCGRVSFPSSSLSGYACVLLSQGRAGQGLLLPQESGVLQKKRRTATPASLPSDFRTSHRSSKANDGREAGPIDRLRVLISFQAPPSLPALFGFELPALFGFELVCGV